MFFDTLYVSFFFVFFNLLFLKLQFMRIKMYKSFHRRLSAFHDLSPQAVPLRILLTIHISVCPLLFLFSLVSRGKTKRAIGRFWAQVDNTPSYSVTRALCQCGMPLRFTTALTNRKYTRSSAIAEGPRDASCQLKSCQLPRNSAETTYTTIPDQIDGMKLEI